MKRKITASNRATAENHVKLQGANPCQSPKITVLFNGGFCEQAGWGIKALARHRKGVSNDKLV